jgi:hypothetical protein
MNDLTKVNEIMMRGTEMVKRYQELKPLLIEYMKFDLTYNEGDRQKQIRERIQELIR